MKFSTLFFALLSSSVVNGLIANPRAESIQDCLGNKNVPVYWPASPNYTELAEPFNLRLQYKPAVIVLPETAKHVQDAVVCAGEFNLKVQAKSGGHSYASFSSGGKDGSMMIDLQGMHDINVDTATNIAKVGGGVRLGNLAQGIYDQGKRALPHGTCPGVGIGGHFTHGGYGHTSRHWGLALDTIVGLDVVIADGTLVHASSTEYPELFWALRGAAESFGVIVSFYLKTEAAPVSITYFQLRWTTLFSSGKDTFVNTFLHIQDFAQNSSVVDDRISFGIYLDGDVYNLGGAFFGTVEEFSSKIQPELTRTLPEVAGSTVEAYDWIGYLKLVSDRNAIEEPLTGYDEHDNFFAKSITVPEKDGLSKESLSAMFDYIKSGQATTSFFVIINLYGGPGSQINTKDTNFAAYNDRDSLWVFQLYGFKEGAGDESIPFIQGLTDSITSAAPQTHFGAYLNYVDPSLDAETAHKLYYGEDLYNRLVVQKEKYDPQEVFWNPQAIGA